MVKTVIRGLGAGKTDLAMARSSKAAPIVSDISKNVASMLGTRQKIPTRTVKDSNNDKDIVSSHLKHLNPFTPQLGRKLSTFTGI